MSKPKIKITAPELNRKLLGQLKKDLKYYRNKNYEEKDYLVCSQDILRLLMNYTNNNGMIISTEYTNYREDNNITFYRTRAVTKANYKKIIEEQQYMSPPSDKSWWGRVNSKNEPMLYTALSKKTAFLENTEIENMYILIYI